MKRNGYGEWLLASIQTDWELWPIGDFLNHTLLLSDEIDFICNTLKNQYHV